MTVEHVIRQYKEVKRNPTGCKILTKFFAEVNFSKVVSVDISIVSGFLLANQKESLNDFIFIYFKVRLFNLDT